MCRDTACIANDRSCEAVHSSSNSASPSPGRYPHAVAKGTCGDKELEGAQDVESMEVKIYRAFVLSGGVGCEND